MEKNKLPSLAVASRSFSKNQVLRDMVLKEYPDAKFNDKGLSLSGNSLINRYFFELKVNSTTKVN